jgi:hypothetical protein
MTNKDTKPVLEDLLGAIQPHTNRGAAEPSEARLYIREHFNTLVAARGRGISWPQIADVLAQAGLTAADGSRLEWRTVNSLFHAERYSRGEKRKRRPKKSTATPATPAASAPTPQPKPKAAMAFEPIEQEDEPEKKPLFTFRKSGPRNFKKE